MNGTKEQFHLSPQQKRAYLMEKAGLRPVLQVVAKIDGQLGYEDMKSILAKIAAERKVLRTVYPDVPGMAVPCQEVDQDPAGVAYAIKEVNDAVSIDELLGSSKLQVSRYKPILIQRAKLSEGLFLIITVSAFAADVVSMIELVRAISRQTSNVPASAGEEIDYLQFSQWQEELLGDNELNAREFWSTRGYSASDQFATPFQSDIHAYAHLQFGLPASIEASVLKRKAEIESYFLAAWATVLKSHSQQPSATLGYTCNRRQFEEIGSLIGLVSRIVPVTIAFGDDQNLLQICSAAARELSELESNQYSYDPAKTDPVSGALGSFAVVFEYIDTSDGGGSEWPITIYTEHEVFGIRLGVINTNGNLTLQYTYNLHLYDVHSVQALHEQLLSVLSDGFRIPGTGGTPGVMSIGHDYAPAHIAGERREIPYSSVNDLFDSICSLYANRPAIEFESRKLTYRKFADDASNIATNLLSNHAIVPGDRIGVLMLRSEMLPVVLTGIMKAGATYVPLDPADAEGRLTHILEDSKCALLVCDSDNPHLKVLAKSVTVVHVDTLIHSVSAQVAFPQVGPDLAAYMIYTSGTSGKPKGVPVSHISLLNYIEWLKHSFQLSPEDSSVLMTSHAFDLGYTSLWGTLLTGGKLFLIPEYLIQKPEVLTQYLKTAGISFLKTTPSILNLLATESRASLSELLGGLRLLLLGGEKMRMDDVRLAWSANPSLRVINHYGPTECTIGVSAHEMVIQRKAYYGSHTVLGKPCINNRISVLDQGMKSCPAGVPGEIYISGLSVARGYFGNEALTAERFLKDIHSGEVLYKTGDRGRINLVGELEFLGRADQQVKINGYRVELGEIEFALRSLPELDDAVVVKPEADQGQLICYYVSEVSFDYEMARSRLGRVLPPYMVPVRWSRINSIPLTANGKTDYKALKDLAAPATAINLKAAHSELSRSMIAVWKAVLNVKDIDVYDNFFYLGGDSIKAIQIAARLYKEGYDIKVKDIFEHPTIAALAQVARRLDLITTAGRKKTHIPLTPVMHNFFENHPNSPHHYNHSLMLHVGDVTAAQIQDAVDALFAMHDMLRIVFTKGADGSRAGEIKQSGFRPTINLIDLTNDEDPGKAMTDYCVKAQGSFSLEEGPLAGFHLFDTAKGRYLAVIMHHLVTDAISWNIILEDLNAALQEGNGTLGEARSLASGSFADWAIQLKAFASAPEIQEQRKYWSSIPDRIDIPFKVEGAANRYADEAVKSISVPLGPLSSNGALHESNSKAVVICSLAAIGLACRQKFNMTEQLVMMESHGREDLIDLNVSRTVGWFTTLYPLYLQFDQSSLEDALSLVSKSLRETPMNGIGYGVLRYLDEQQGNDDLRHNPPIRFNYLGESNLSSASGKISVLQKNLGPQKSPTDNRPYIFDIVSFVSRGELHLNVSCSKHQFSGEFVDAWMQSIAQFLSEGISSEGVIDGKLVSNRFSYTGMTEKDLENFFNN